MADRKLVDNTLGHIDDAKNHTDMILNQANVMVESTNPNQVHMRTQMRLLIRALATERSTYLPLILMVKYDTAGQIYSDASDAD